MPELRHAPGACRAPAACLWLGKVVFGGHDLHSRLNSGLARSVWCLAAIFVDILPVIQSKQKPKCDWIISLLPSHSSYHKPQEFGL